MTDVTQMQMITFLCSFHEAFWMVWWMERDHAHGLYGSDGRENKLLMGNKRSAVSDPWIWILMVRYEGDAVLPSGITPFYRLLRSFVGMRREGVFSVCRRLSAGTGGNVVVRRQAAGIRSADRTGGWFGVNLWEIWSYNPTR